MSIEDDVRTGLRVAARDLDTDGVPRRMHAAGLRDSARRQRRRRAGTAGAALAVAAVVAGVPFGVAALRSDPPPTAAPTVTEVDVLGLPTRGSLAGDQGFLDAVTQLSWVIPDMVSDPPDPVAPVGSRRVAFAGDVPGGRWALVVGENPAPATGAPELQTDLGALSDVAGIWFVGPEGATPDQMEPVTIPRGMTADRVVTLSDPSTGTVVVLAAPGDRIALSPRPVVAADAGVTRDWTELDADGGVAVGRLPAAEAPVTYRTAGQVRVTRDGIEIARQSPDQFGHPGGVPTVGIPIEYLRERTPTAELGDQGLALDLLGALGLGIDEVRFQVLWAGEVPGPDDGPAYATVMTATLPSGAVVVLGSDLRVTDAGGDGVYYGGGTGVRELRPAGGPVTERVVAMPSELSGTGGSDTVRSLVVVVPDGADRVRALDADGRELATLRVEGGAAVGPFPAGTVSVEVSFDDGRPAVTSPLGTFTGEF